MIVDLEQIARDAVADATDVSRQTPETDFDSLVRYQAIRMLSGYKIRDLKAACTLSELTAERGRLGRALVKNDVVNILTSRVLASI